MLRGDRVAVRLWRLVVGRVVVVLVLVCPTSTRVLAAKRPVVAEWSVVVCSYVMVVLLSRCVLGLLLGHITV